MNRCQYTISNHKEIELMVEDMKGAIKEHGELQAEWKRLNKRSLSQNALFHAWCSRMSAHFDPKGERDLPPEKIKMMMKHRFLGTETIVVSNYVIEDQVRKTSDLDKGEMFFFMEQVLAWAADHGCLLPTPSDSEFSELMREQNGQ